MASADPDLLDFGGKGVLITGARMSRVLYSPAAGSCAVAANTKVWAIPSSNGKGGRARRPCQRLARSRSTSGRPRERSRKESDMTRFGQTMFTAAAAGLFVLGALAASAGAASPSGGELDPATDDRSIRPFQFHAPDEALADLRRRIAATKWPSQELVTDASQGVQLATMRELARYWQTDYDWRKAEAKLNALPQFKTNIDGVEIHFIHVRSKHPNALPLIVTHGWPGSIIEQLKIIDPLTNPTAHGGSASDAFDVVIPSLPGHGFSGKPTTLGWDPIRIARAWTVLMKRLGYTRFVAQGGDWGNAVTEQMALQAPPELLGIHTNMPATVPAAIEKALWSGGAAPPGLTADERHAYDQLDLFYKNGLSYAQEMSHRPQTLYGIDDSPIGLAAWMLDHDASSYALMARVFSGQKEGLTRDDILDNVTLYWLTSTGVSSARLYWESKLAFFAPKGIAIPVAVSAFPDELYQAPRSWAERAYPKLVYYNKLDKGGHFAAWEQPELLVADLRAGFKSLR
jgi:pimeloyl-ACP methyl ester carboxylesterase